MQGLLLSMKDTGIPDESFFATAALWLISTAEVRSRVCVCLFRCVYAYVCLSVSLSVCLSGGMFAIYARVCVYMCLINA